MNKLQRFCNICDKKFTPTSSYNKVCTPCTKIQHIKSMFKRHGKFKDCTKLKDAIKKYGK